MKEIALEEVEIVFPAGLITIPVDMFGSPSFLMKGRASFSSTLNNGAPIHYLSRLTSERELETSEIEKIEYVNNDDILVEIPLESLTKKALSYAYDVFDTAAWKQIENK